MKSCNCPLEIKRKSEGITRGEVGELLPNVSLKEIFPVHLYGFIVTENKLERCNTIISRRKKERDRLLPYYISHFPFQRKLAVK